MLTGMQKIANIHTFEDRLFLRDISHMSLLVYMCGLAATAALVVTLGALAPQALDPAFRWIAGAGSFSLPWLAQWLCALGVVSLATLLVHEVVHGLFFKLFAPAGSRVTFGANWNMGMLYTCAEGIIYTRRQYVITLLAPSMLVSTAILAAACAVGNPVFGVLAAAIHLSGCTGDWGYVHKICQNPSITHCEDTAWGVQFYHASAAASDHADARNDSSANAEPAASTTGSSSTSASSSTTADSPSNAYASEESFAAQASALDPHCPENAARPTRNTAPTHPEVRS